MGGTAVGRQHQAAKPQRSVFKPRQPGDRRAAGPVECRQKSPFAGKRDCRVAMIDRFQSRWARKYMLEMPPLGDGRERKGFFISAGGRKVADLFEPALVMIKTTFTILNITYAGELLFRGIDEKGAIAKHPDALQQAFLAGQKIVEE